MVYMEASLFNAFLFAVSHYGAPVIPYIFGGVINSFSLRKIESIVAPVIGHIIIIMYYFLAALYYLSCK